MILLIFLFSTVLAQEINCIQKGGFCHPNFFCPNQLHFANDRGECGTSARCCPTDTRCGSTGHCEFVCSGLRCNLASTRRICLNSPTFQRNTTAEVNGECKKFAGGVFCCYSSVSAVPTQPVTPQPTPQPNIFTTPSPVPFLTSQPTPQPSPRPTPAPTSKPTPQPTPQPPTSTNSKPGTLATTSTALPTPLPTPSPPATVPQTPLTLPTAVNNTVSSIATNTRSSLHTNVNSTLLHHNTLNIADSSSLNNDLPWLWIIIGGGICLFLMCISILIAVLIKKKKNNSNHSIDPNDSFEQSTPVSPSSNYGAMNSNYTSQAFTSAVYDVVPAAEPPNHNTYEQPTDSFATDTQFYQAFNNETMESNRYVQPDEQAMW